MQSSSYKDGTASVTCDIDSDITHLSLPPQISMNKFVQHFESGEGKCLNGRSQISSLAYDG